MVVQILQNLARSLGGVAKETGQFRQAAGQQNRDISKFMKDVSKMFASQSKQNNNMSSSLDDIQAINQQTSTRVDRTNSLIQESISLQSQMLSELRNISTGISSLMSGGGGQQNSGSSFGAALAGGAALGLGASMLSGYGLDMLKGLGVDTSSTGTPSGEGAGSSQNAETALNYFRSQGWTAEQAAGIVGNLQAESTPNLDPRAIGDSGEAKGIAQWHAPRREIYETQFRPGAKFDESTFQDQLEFINWELQNNYKAAGEKLRGAKTAGEAAIIVDESYEQSSGAARQERINNAFSLMPRNDSAESGEQDEGNNNENARALGTQPRDPSGQLTPKNSPTAGGSVTYANSSAIRNQPIQPRLMSILQGAARETGVDVEIFSGGQSRKGSGGRRTGSTRHDDGNAADIRLKSNNQLVTDQNILAKFIASVSRLGATGIGHGPGYMGPGEMHVGFGNPAVWGAGGRSANAPAWVKTAASGVYNNQDLSGSGNAMASLQGYGGMPDLGALGIGFGGSELAGAIGMLSGAGANFQSMINGILGVNGSEQSQQNNNNNQNTAQDTPEGETGKEAGQNPVENFQLKNNFEIVQNDNMRTEQLSQSSSRLSFSSVPKNDSTQKNTQEPFNDNTNKVGVVGEQLALNSTPDNYVLADWYTNLFGKGGGNIVPDRDFYNKLA